VLFFILLPILVELEYLKFGLNIKNQSINELLPTAKASLGLQSQQ
jgi:hypothetical protein